MEDNNKIFRRKVFVITGGTGSFGNVMARHLLTLDVAEVRILSRDESKQDLMRRTINDQRMSFYIGDVRDSTSLEMAFRGADYVFHAAALKHVPSSEFHPVEAVKTNVMGTENVIRASIANNIEKIVLLSTDKAVQPVNVMGMSKGIMERTALSFARLVEDKPKICITRYGNVIASRGSVVPHFLRQAKEGHQLTITDPSMTRFIMSLVEAVDLVIYAFNNGESGDLFVQKSPAATVQQIAEVTNRLVGRSGNEHKIIGVRHGEKKFETLVSEEEIRKSVDCGQFYKVPMDDRSLNYDNYVSVGVRVPEVQKEYNSDNTSRLTNDELFEILANNAEVKEILENVK
jgi:UDP-N-acetylglucosamine 4,6-dehydratase/5-epimerase